MTLLSPIGAAAETPTQPRARGQVRVSARRVGQVTALERLFQSGSGKALLPRGEDPGLSCVLLNTAGGVTGGDRFAVDVAARPDTRLTLSTQAAERVYRAQPGETGEIRNRLEIAAGARIDWLPQETILFDGARLERRLEADLAEDATLLAAEAVILGRPAMGERVTNLRFTDHWRIRRGGRLIYADALRLCGDADATAARPVCCTLRGTGR